MSLGQAVIEFNHTYDVPPVVDEGLPHSEYQLVYRLLAEELQEISRAYVNQDKVNFIKELADVVYVAAQQMARYGVDVDKVMAIVHESNMSKLGEDGEVLKREDGKILKGPNYFAAEDKLASYIESLAY